MPKVLVVSAVDLSPELGRTVVWGRGVERTFVPRGEDAFGAAQVLMPSMVVLDGADRWSTIELIGRLRENPGTRRSSIVVISRSPSLDDEGVLRAAGANLVLSGEVDPDLWDNRLEELTSVPRRREARIPVRFEVWSRVDPSEAAVEALALNISVNGMLLETEDPIDLGTKLDLAFTLPGQSEEVRVVGQVVREADNEGRPRSGIEFLIPRGDARDRIRVFIAGGTGH